MYRCHVQTVIRLAVVMTAVSESLDQARDRCHRGRWTCLVVEILVMVVVVTVSLAIAFVGILGVVVVALNGIAVEAASCSWWWPSSSSATTAVVAVGCGHYH